MSDRQNIKKASGTKDPLCLCEVSDSCSQAWLKIVGDRQTDTHTHRHTHTHTDAADNMIVAPLGRGNYNDITPLVFQNIDIFFHN